MNTKNYKMVLLLV